MWAVLPLMALPVAVYNLFALLALPAGLKGEAGAELSRPLFSIPLASHGVWTVGVGDLFVFGALVILFIELLKASDRRDVAIINHSLSMILFIVCLVEFLLLRAFATSAFFLIASMVLLDVLAGFIVTISAELRGR